MLVSFVSRNQYQNLKGVLRNSVLHIFYQCPQILLIFSLFQTNRGLVCGNR